MPQNSRQKIGIVIVTYNAAAYILPCLDSIFANTYTNFVCVIVDNASTDNTIQVIRKKYKDIVIVKNKKNLGFSAGVNRGILLLLKKNCASILLLNPDTKVTRNSLFEISKPLYKDNTIGIVGCLITYEKRPQLIWYGGGYINDRFLLTRHLHMNQSVRKAQIVSGNTDFVTGACMLIRTEVLRKVGLLDESYFLYFEDVFYCLKVKEAGYKVFFLAKPLVIHRVSASTGIPGENTLTPNKAYYFGRNPLLFIKTNRSGIKKTTNIAGQLLVQLPYFLGLMLVHKQTRAIISYMRGVRDGLLSKY